MTQPITITHNLQEQRFETTQEGYTAFLSYQIQGDNLLYDHTIVPSELGGRGIGSALAKYALDYATAQRKSVIPQCSFVARYIEKHPEYQILVS